VMVYCTVISMLLSIVHLVFKGFSHYRMMAALKMMEEAQMETMALLAVVKGWAERAKEHGSVTREALEKVTTATETVAEKAAVIQAVVSANEMPTGKHPNVLPPTG
jgi:glucosamine 6-phosphate synthetase-like amidotransferase/phosphosugar isomerase protein